MIEGEVLKRYELSLDDILPQIMETIIEVYGERHRKQIENNFKRAYLNSYITYDRIKSDYNKKLNLCRTKISLDFLKKIGEKIDTEEEKNSTLFGPAYLSEEHKNILDKYMGDRGFNEDGTIFSFDDSLLETDNEYRKKVIIQKRCDLFKKLGYEVTPENYKEKIASPDMQEALAHIQKVYKIALECREEFDKFNEENKDYDEYFEKCDKYKKELELKYLKESYRRVLPLCSEEEQKKIQDALENESLTGIYRFSCEIDREGKYFASYGESLIMAFSEENDKYIEDGKWQGKSAQRARIQYFKSMGLDLGDEYEAYQKSEEAQKLIPDKDLVKEVLRIKEECKNAEKREFFIHTGNYEQCKKNLLKQGIKDESDFSIEFAKKAVVCVETNFIENENGEDEPFYPIHIPMCGLMEGSNDVLLVHELLHVAEFSAEKIGEKQYFFKTGLDVSINDIPRERAAIFDDDKTLGIDREKRDYEILSENLHQRLAIKVTRKLHEKGIFILDSPEYVTERRSSTYEEIDVITQEIRERHEEDIIDSMMAPTMEEVEDRFGKENLIALNSCVRKFRAIPYYKYKGDLVDNKDTELTRYASELIGESKTISDNITEYVNNRFKIRTAEIGKNTLDVARKDKKIAMQVVSYDKELEIGGRTENGE